MLIGSCVDGVLLKGHDLEIGTNCLAPYLLTLLLEPVLAKTATSEGVSKGSVRIVWVTSLLQAGTPPGGMQFDGHGNPVYLKKFMANYMQSKAGDAWLADRFAKRLGDKGVLSLVGFVLEGCHSSIPNSTTEPASWTDAYGAAEALDGSEALDYGEMIDP